MRTSFWIHVLTPVTLLSYSDDPRPSMVEPGRYQVSRVDNPVGLLHPWYVIETDAGTVGKECRNFLDQLKAEQVVTQQ